LKIFSPHTMQAI